MDDDNFFIGVFFGGLLTLFISYLWFSSVPISKERLNKAEAICKEANSEILAIYLYGDLVCLNGLKKE